MSAKLCFATSSRPVRGGRGWKPGYGGGVKALSKEMESNKLPYESLRRHPLTLPADRLHAPRLVVLGCCIAVRGVTRLACDRRRLKRLSLGIENLWTQRSRRAQI
jgi:hypothetical protein